jgi:EmrB/QacA subfamily drug resistance transporter
MSTSRPSPLPPDSPITERQLTLVLVGVGLATVLASLDSTVLTTALPTIVGDLGGLNHLTWVITAFLLSATVAATVYGKLGDLYGRKRLFLISVSIFVVGSLLCAVAQSMDQLIIYRVIQGAGAGGLTVGSQGILGDLVVPSQRGRYAGVLAGAFAVTAVLGPLVGGLFTQHLSWRWAFYINLPLGAIVFLTLAIVVPSFSGHPERRIDYLGMILLSGFSVCVILALTWGGTQYAWTSSEVLSLVAIAVLLAPVFIWVERRAKEPVVPLRLFSSGVFTVSVVGTGISTMVMVGEVTFFPLYLQVVHGASPTVSGLETAPTALLLLAATIVAGRRIARTGNYRTYPIVGSALLIVATGVIAWFGTTTGAPYWHLALGMGVLGIGMALTNTIYTLTTQNSAPQRDMGVAISVMATFRSIGGALGVAILGVVFTRNLTASLGSRSTQLGGDPAHLTPAQLNSLHTRTPALYNHFIDAFSHSLHDVFIGGVMIAVGALLISLLLKQEPLRHTHTPAPAAVEPEGLVGST